MQLFLYFSSFYLILILTINFIIPWIIFSFLIKKEWYDFSALKSIFEIFIAKITCFLIAILFWWVINAILLLIFNFLWINEKIIVNYIVSIFSIIIYFFFYYKFLKSTLWFFIFDEEIKKKILLKFILFSEIISNIIFLYWISWLLFRLFYNFVS